MEVYLVKAANLRKGMNVLNRGTVKSVQPLKTDDEGDWLSIRFEGLAWALKFESNQRLWVEKKPPACGRSKGESVGGVTIE